MTDARLLGERYEIGAPLGYGGMAEVHHGRDLRLGRDVAIKVLRSDLARDPGFQARFRREAQNAAALNHPAIVAVYDTGEDVDGHRGVVPYIVMEYVEGRTLKDVLQAEGRLMPQRAMEITADVCAALEFSHRHGIVHRDIKPGNVMLTPNGTVKVMDFGIARAVASASATMTATSAVIGTAQYLSPEQARGETVDARSDVYSTGCLLYELLVGQPPFTGDNPVSVAYQHVREDPIPPSERNPELSPALDAIVLKAMAKNPANRYQSADEMRADLLRAAAGRPVSATPVLTAEEPTAVFTDADAAVRTAAPPPDPASAPRRGRGRPRRGRVGAGRPTHGSRPRTTDRPAPTDFDRLVGDAVRATVAAGRLLFNPPDTMRQGVPERVEVAVARSLDLDEVLRARLRGRGVPRVETIDTSPFMAVELSGSAFAVTRLAPRETAEQLLAPTARWEFDVEPLRAGKQQLLLSVTLRIPVPGRSDERVAVPVVERRVRVQVDVVYGGRRFVRDNWQWLAATAIGLGGAITAWVSVFH